MRKINRREFLITGASGTLGIVFGYSDPEDSSDIDEYITVKMNNDKIPGLSACLIKNNKIVWEKSYGYENIEKNKRMSMDSILNIGSVSKTITSAALLQLWEKDRFKLDDDINKYLPFKVRNPNYSKTNIKFRQLLTHTSSINDGSNYPKSYACGDPAISLDEWLKEYLIPGGKFFVREENFNNWQPGRNYDYSNIGFGLIGYLVECISGISFDEYCQTNIFNPLDMNDTSWFISGLDQTNFAVPYCHISKAENIDRKLIKDSVLSKNFIPLCFYSFPNYPDGLLHTSVRQLSHFLMTFMNYGIYKNRRLLQNTTLLEIFSNQTHNIQLPAWMSHQGLAWNAGALGSGKIIWGHSGSDPGISTRMHFDPQTGSGMIIFANSNADLWDLTNVLFSEIIN